MNKLPWQLTDGSPVNPGGQAHEKLPGVFEQMALSPHRLSGARETPWAKSHSSIS